MTQRIRGFVFRGLAYARRHFREQNLALSGRALMSVLQRRQQRPLRRASCACSALTFRQTTLQNLTGPMRQLMSTPQFGF